MQSACKVKIYGKSKAAVEMSTDKKMIKFLFNSEWLETSVSPASVLLDFIRNEKRLTGTKEGCREGDCGACAVLIGELCSGKVKYKVVNSCLVPMRDLHGKHLVTIESLNQNELTPIQLTMAEEGGTQCGFCTPGFVVSMTGYFLNNKKLDLQEAMDSLGGNICRCTGYAGIERAVKKSIEIYEQTGETKDHLTKLIDAKFVPSFFKSVPKLLAGIDAPKAKQKVSEIFIGGGTDLYVQKWEELSAADHKILSGSNIPDDINLSGNKIRIGGGATIQQLIDSAVIKKYFPLIQNDLQLFGSLPIRNRATVAGNIVNASPIGDLTNILLVLDAGLILKYGKTNRQISLRKFFLDYKLTDRKKNELIEWILLPVPQKEFYFNFEKISKRKYLDIASVNSSIALITKKNKIIKAGVSAGGVSPVPLFLKKTSAFLKDRLIATETVREAAKIALSEISPISDARGSDRYKRLLLRQLIYAHFLILFPSQIDETALIRGAREL